MNNVSFSNNMDNMLFRTGYKLFYASPGGRQHRRQTSGTPGSQKQDVIAGATPVLTEGSPGSNPRAAKTQRRSAWVTGLHAALGSLNFKSNKVKPQQIKSRNEQRLQRGWKLFPLSMRPRRTPVLLLCRSSDKNGDPSAPQRTQEAAASSCLRRYIGEDHGRLLTF